MAASWVRNQSRGGVVYNGESCKGLNLATFPLLLRAPAEAGHPQSGRGEIGRRTRLRIWRREAWGFESLRPDQKKSRFRAVFLPSMLPHYSFTLSLLARKLTP